MSSIVNSVGSSVGSLVEAGVKGLLGFAESLEGTTLVQVEDVSSGWIHIPAAYVGEEATRSFGIKNLVGRDVKIKLASDLSNLKSDKDTFTLAPNTTHTVTLSFQPQSTAETPPDPLFIHRAFSTHGLVSIRASADTTQSLSIPFFATICRSAFTAALIDPATGLTLGPQQSSGRLDIDFGSECVVGVYHRDILLVNRSEIQLVWTTIVVNARDKHAVWFSLRDLDSENVFGVDNSEQLPLPPLSSRHLRLELLVQSPTDFHFDFVLSNMYQPDNSLTCHVVGSAGTTDALKILSGTSIDFGQIYDGTWAKKVVTCKNTGDKALDVKFSSTFDVVFCLAGVAGEDMDEEPHRRDTSSSRAPSPISSEDLESRSSSRPPSRGLSRVTSRSQYESEDEDPEPDKLLNQIEELSMRPGTEYRVFILYRPTISNQPHLIQSSFQVYIDSSTSRHTPLRRTLHCTALSCSSLIDITSGRLIDFGEVTVGASKAAIVTITNKSALSARVEIFAISKVLSSNRNIIVIPPHESVEERIEFFPRRINDRYEKQMFVRNLLNRANDQVLEIRSKNTDVYNLTIHSHLYRILTPSGSNFLDFGPVVINSPTIRTVYFENLTNAPLLLDLLASQPEDVELFIKSEDIPVSVQPGRYTEPMDKAPSGQLKERFMETMRELSAKAEPKKKKKHVDKTDEPSVGASVAAALKKGGRGRPVQLYGNSVIFKDRYLLEKHEYLDIAAGPPVAAHRASPRSKRTALLDAIELEDKTKLSGQHAKIDFAAGAKGMLGKKKRIFDPVKSPALTAKRVEPKEVPHTDVSKMTVDELVLAMEHQDARKASITHSTIEDEEQYVRQSMALRKELAASITTGKLVPARALPVNPRSMRQLVVIMTPNGSTRPHVSTKAKRADSRLFIKLASFDRSMLATTDELPVRDLVIRSWCVRSVLEVQQTSINFGGCDKGEAKSKTIVIQNKSDCIGMFRLRTSGSIASGDLKLGAGRLGVIAAFGRKEVEQFRFTPSLVGNYQETLVVENILDSYNDQNVSVKAVVRKQPAMVVEPTTLNFAFDSSSSWPDPQGFVLTNVTKHERTFVIESSQNQAFAEVSLSHDAKSGGTALSKGEEEEVEALLQKLKIARRKGKGDKVTKYETRLGELGVNDESSLPTPTSELAQPLAVVSSLSVTLLPNQKTKLVVNLHPRPHHDPLAANISIYERKNTDETLVISVQASHQLPSAASEALSSQEPLHLSIMQHCLQLTLQCPVSQTAFCVGSTLFLSDTSSLYPQLSPHFASFPNDDPDPAGLILSDGYSRQIPGNTHAEANALANFRTKYTDLVKTVNHLAPMDEILAQADCYATMEPCSVRTSGGPSCASELVWAKVRTVYLGVEEPPDFVQCEGVRILQDGGVVVERVVGLEDECLRAARRGRS